MRRLRHQQKCRLSVSKRKEKRNNGIKADRAKEKKEDRAKGKKKTKPRKKEDKANGIKYRKTGE